MKIIDETSLPVACLKDHHENNFSVDQATVNALAIDFKKNGQKESIIVIVDPDEAESYLVINGRHRKSALIINGETMARCSIVEYEDKFELIEDILSGRIRSVKCECDKAMEFDKNRTVLNRTSGQRTDLSKEEKGKTNDIIASKYPEKICGDQVGKYLLIYDNYKGLLDLVQRDMLSIGAAANVISLMLDEECDFSQITIGEIADMVYIEVNSEEYPEIEKLSAEEVEALLGKYAKKLSGLKKPITNTKKEKPKPTEPQPGNITDAKPPVSDEKASGNGNETATADGENEKEAKPKTANSSAPQAPQKLSDSQVEPKQLYIMVGPDQYELYTCSCKDCPNKCTQSK